MSEKERLEREILLREQALRRWFVRGCDPVRARIDGLDIGWGGVQRWITGRVDLAASRRHLDFACGYATFAAQLAWRFSQLRIVGVNIDFVGPHALADDLVWQAGVASRCRFVEADARALPFSGASFDSASCFLGLQDIEIGFGDAGVRAAVGEAVRVLKPRGTLVLADEYDVVRWREILEDQPMAPTCLEERALDIRWPRDVAEEAIGLYAEGYGQQIRAAGSAERTRGEGEVRARLRRRMERQLADQGYVVPFAPVRLLIAIKASSPACRRGADP